LTPHVIDTKKIPSMPFSGIQGIGENFNGIQGIDSKIFEQGRVVLTDHL